MAGWRPLIQFALGQFSFGHFKNIVACPEIIWFSRRWLFCSSPATSCKAMLLGIGCFGQGPQLLLVAILAQCFKGCFGLGAMSQEAKNKWERVGARWQERFLLDPPDPSKGSWLDLKESPWRIGCKACSSAGLSGNLASYGVNTVGGLQAVNFKKHGNHPRHKAAVQKLLLPDDSPAGCPQDAAPDLEHFRAVFQQCQKAQGFESKKDQQMIWCLAEAMKSIDQQWLAKASAIALFRDERKGRILIRFRIVTNDLQCHCGTLGQERDAGTGAMNLTAATYRVFKRACGRWTGAPQCRPIKAKPFVKWALLRHLRKSITTITVDAAADEVVSAELMRSSVINVSQTKMTPNLRCVIRDKAHSSRRITSRPWSVDSFLSDTLQNFCTGRGSIARLMQHSSEIRRVFADFAKTSESAVDTIVANFRAAGHRFESHSKPLGRTCLFLHACVRTALHLVRSRKDDSAQRARAWLLWLNEERLLQAAMLADAADSSIRLTRKMDSEEMDPANLAYDVALYLQEIKALFLNGEVLRQFGYTSTMLDLLQTPLVFHVGSVTKSIGSQAGVSEEIKSCCLHRMQAWTKLAAAALQAEFPACEVGQSFKVFNLRQGTTASARDDIRRIAGVYGLNAALLEQQWSDIFPRAQLHFKPEDNNLLCGQKRARNQDAWQVALQEVSATQRRQQNHPSQELRKALVQYFAFGGSSSGVEQAFGKSTWAFHTRRWKAMPCCEEMIVKIALDSGNYNEEVLLKRARQCWFQCYGRPRASGSERPCPRIDKGLTKKRLPSSTLNTETSFIKKRRVAAASVAAGFKSDGNDFNQPGVDKAWSEGHDRELAFQEQKARTRALQALAENSLLPAEMDDNLLP